MDESPELKRTREQICALSAETRVPSEIDSSLPFIHNNITELKVFRQALFSFVHRVIVDIE